MTWDSRENGRKDGWSIFQGRLHGRLRYRKVPNISCKGGHELMFSLPRNSVSTLGEFHSSIPSELLIRFAFPFSQKSAS